MYRYHQSHLPFLAGDIVLTCCTSIAIARECRCSSTYQQDIGSESWIRSACRTLVLHRPRLHRQQRPCLLYYSPYPVESVCCVLFNATVQTACRCPLHHVPYGSKFAKEFEELLRCYIIAWNLSISMYLSYSRDESKRSDNLRFLTNSALEVCQLLRSRVSLANITDWPLGQVFLLDSFCG